MIRRICTVAFVLAAASSHADITYRVLPKPAENRLVVTVEIPTRGGETTVQMPRWAPGAYVLSVPGRNVQVMRAVDERGVTLPVTAVDDSTWRIGAGTGVVRVTYSVPDAYTDEAMHYSGPATYVYVVGRKGERCHLQIQSPTDWRIAVGLDPEGGANSFGAPTYDVLADNPVTMGHFLEDHYTSAGRDHTIAMRNPAKSKVNRAYLMKATKFVSDMHTDFFGGAPYHKYVWHFAVNDAQDGAGGLEHLSSTQISLASGVGPRAVGVLSHEFFHLWNVKRIRSKTLGPFDYQRLPKTGALWWLEGTTDYFAHLLLNRYGWFDGKEMREQIGRNLTRQRSKAARFEISPYQASYRVGEANGGRGNSDGYLVSYYDTGFLVGLCLDIEILDQTHGRRSLDDVEKGLWRMTRNDRPGFEEGEIRNQCVRVGGASLGPFYDRVVMQPGELPLEAQLAKIGLRLAKSSETIADLGFEASPSGPRTPFAVRTVSGASWGGLKVGDEILEVNGTALGEGLGGFRGATANLKPGDTVTLKVARTVNGTRSEETVTGTVGSGTRDTWTVEDDPGATPEAKRLAAIWMSKKRKG